VPTETDSLTKLDSTISPFQCNAHSIRAISCALQTQAARFFRPYAVAWCLSMLVLVHLRLLVQPKRRRRIDRGGRARTHTSNALGPHLGLSSVNAPLGRKGSTCLECSTPARFSMELKHIPWRARGQSLSGHYHRSLSHTRTIRAELMQSVSLIGCLIYAIHQHIKCECGPSLVCHL